MLNQLRDTRKILDHSDLQLVTMLDGDIPYSGYVNLKMRMEGWRDNVYLEVPFLVTDHTLDQPLIGTNILEEVVLNPNTYIPAGKSFLALFRDCFSEKSQNGVEGFVNLIRSKQKLHLNRIKTVKRPIIVPSGSNVNVECPAGNRNWSAGPLIRWFDFTAVM